MLRHGRHVGGITQQNILSLLLSAPADVGGHYRMICPMRLIANEEYNRLAAGSVLKVHTSGPRVTTDGPRMDHGWTTDGPRVTKTDFRLSEQKKLLLNRIHVKSNSCKINPYLLFLNSLL